MSYLSSPRMHFAGYFQADVSTINNDVRHFDSAAFLPKYQLPQHGNEMNGWWNPEGSGAYRLVQCTITGGVLNGNPIATASDDPAIGMTISGSDGRVSGKLVDLDPQQQMVSQIWGMSVRLTDGSAKDLFNSEYRVAPFMNLWRRQQGPSQGDQTLAAKYQSVLENVVWSDTLGSPLVDAIRAASDDGVLSIDFNVFGYKMDASSPTFTLGRIIGTIGPAGKNDPAHFVIGRHLMATFAGGDPTTPMQGIYNLPCVVDTDSTTVTANLGNAIPISNADGTPQNLGELQMAVLKNTGTANGDVIDSSEIEILGQVPYRGDGWYTQTAGVIDFPYTGNQWVEDNIHDRPLALVRPAGHDDYSVLIREGQDGLYMRADEHVYRLDPGTSASVEFFASRYGHPHEGKIDLSANNTMIGGGGGPNQLHPHVDIPDVGDPPDAISYPNTIATDANGRATLTLTASPTGPGNPRQYIDGQLYGIGYSLTDQPPGYNSNPWLFVSVLVWDAIEAPDEPTWYRDIQPIMQQYGNLYPIMSKHLVDLGDYQSVVEHRSILKLAFGLPVSDPNYMPVTRDLSSAKRDMLLAWLDSIGPNGLPIKGHSQQSGARGRASLKAAVGSLTESVSAAATAGGKTTFLENLKQKAR